MSRKNIDEGLSIVQGLLRDQPTFPPGAVPVYPPKELFVLGFLQQLEIPIDAESLAFAGGAYDIMTDNTPESTPDKLALLHMIEERLQTLKMQERPE